MRPRTTGREQPLTLIPSFNRRGPAAAAHRARELRLLPEPGRSEARIVVVVHADAAQLSTIELIDVDQGQGRCEAAFRHSPNLSNRKHPLCIKCSKLHYIQVEFS